MRRLSVAVALTLLLAGSRPALATSTSTPTGSPSPTATRTPVGAALLVVFNTTLNADDQVLFDRLTTVFNLSVTTVQDSASLAAQATGKAVVVISGTSVSTNIGNRFRDVTVPVWLGEEALYDDMEMTTGAGLGNTASQTQINVVVPGHYIAGGLGGNRTVFAPADTVNWGLPNGNATVIARVSGSPTDAALFVYEAGAGLFNGFTAAARRVGFFTEDMAPSSLTGDGLTFFDNSIGWLLGYDTVPTATPSITPTPTPSITLSHTPSPTPSATETSTNSPSPTFTVTPSITETSTATPSITETSTATPSITETSTATPSNTETSTVTPSITETSTATPSVTETSTATPSITETSTATPSITETSTATPSITETSTVTPTITETETPSQTETSTASPPATETSTATSSVTETSTGSPSITETSTVTPTDTPTPTVTPTATPTSTVTETISPTNTATPTNTPQVSLQARVYDSAGRLIYDLGTRFSYSSASSVQALPDPFAPELGSLAVSSAGQSWAWAGDTASGDPAPNGPYKIVVTQSAGADVEVSFWVKRAKLALKALAAVPNPARSNGVTIYVDSTPGWQTELRVYNVSAELVHRLALASGQISVFWDLKNSAGSSVSPGIYLVQALYTKAGARQMQGFKLAVLR